MNRKLLGKNVTRYRVAAGLNQEQLAEKIGISANFMSNIERGNKMPSLETYVKLANALNISSDVLLADDIVNAYSAKATVLQEQIEKLSSEDKQRVFTIIEAFLDKYKNE